MKAQLVSLLLFAVPIIMQLMVADGVATTEPTPATSDLSTKDISPPATTSPATAAKPAPVKKTPPSTRGSRIPAKLAPWLM